VGVVSGLREQPSDGGVLLSAGAEDDGRRRVVGAVHDLDSDSIKKFAKRTRTAFLAFAWECLRSSVRSAAIRRSTIRL
jgi:hypothetical protein